MHYASATDDAKIYDYDARVYLYTKPVDQMAKINSDVIPTDLMVHF